MDQSFGIEGSDNSILDAVDLSTMASPDTDNPTGNAKGPEDEGGPVSSHDDLESLGELFDNMQTRMEQDRIAELTGERDDWKTKANEAFHTSEVLQKRMAAKSAIGSTVDPDFVSRLNRLEWENRHLALENSRLKREVQDEQRKFTLLNDENEGKSRKLRGANKKTINAKGTADKEAEKAKEAVHQRDQRLKLQRQQQKDMKAALAEVQTQKKAVQALESELHVARSGWPYLRDEKQASEDTTVAFSVSMRINRRHFPLIKSMLENSQAEMTANLEDAYSEWKEVRNIGTGFDHDGRRSVRDR